MEIRNKKILVFGLARSGVGAANLLVNLGAEVTATDRKTDGELGEYIKLLSPYVKRCLGNYPLHLNGTDMIVVSPGVPLSIEPIQIAQRKGIKVIGELELAYQIISNQSTTHGQSASHQTKFLAITGTNGKSTTTTLLDLMLRKAGSSTILAGNIGNALSEEIYKIISSGRLQVTGNDNNSSLVNCNSLPDYVVAEVSSFQLESIDRFKPEGAAILNITPDHLDRYHSMDEYSEAKAAIFRNQDKNDFLVLNADDHETMKLYDAGVRMQDAGCPRVYFFSRQKEVEGVYFKDGFVCCSIASSELATRKLKLIHVDEIRIKGVHNLENAMASAAMALLAGCLPDAVTEALREFNGLEHRLEFVREIDGVRYINDSKGTNIGAVLKSIEGFSEPVVLIAGGRDKAGDFSPLKPLIREKVRAIVLIGEAAEKMSAIFGDIVTTVVVSDLEEAINRAREMAEKGDVVLLSPACASFDMFRDFEDRGRQFKDIVKRLS